MTTPPPTSPSPTQRPLRTGPESHPALGTAGRRSGTTAARIGRSYQAVYREIARNCKPDGSYERIRLMIDPEMSANLGARAVHFLSDAEMACG
jgi:hypothetical protein